jgi:hypothetical protein
VNNATIGRAKIETSLQEWSLLSMKTLSLILAMFFLLFSAVVARGANVTRISAETGVPVETLQAERASTGLGWGGLEKAHLLANASGQSFDDIVALHKAGQAVSNCTTTAQPRQGREQRAPVKPRDRMVRRLILRPLMA